MTTENNNSNYKLVEDWMKNFGQEVPVEPCIPSLEVRKLRAKLILEEALELIIQGLGLNGVVDNGYGGVYDLVHLQESVKGTDLDLEEFKKPSLEEIADGCADLKVVTLGTEVACGIGNSKSEEIFNEVMRSNWTKLWTPNEYCHTNYEQEANYTFVYKGKNETQERSEDTQNRCYLVKDSIGKVIKSPSYSPANIQQFLA